MHTPALKPSSRALTAAANDIHGSLMVFTAGGGQFIRLLCVCIHSELKGDTSGSHLHALLAPNSAPPSLHTTHSSHGVDCKHKRQLLLNTIAVGELKYTYYCCCTSTDLSLHFSLLVH